MDFQRIRMMAGLLCLLVLAGCATSGRDFPADALHGLEPGATTKKDVLSRLGEPLQERTFTTALDMAGGKLPQPIIVQSLSYSYQEPSAMGNGFIPGVWPQRWATIFLVDHNVIGYYIGSSFKADSTDFDTAAAGNIKRKVSTEKEILDLFGSRHGKAMYPMARSPSGRSLFYNIVLHGHPAGQTTTKRLRINLNSEGVVEDFEVESKADANPVAPATVPIFIYTPARR
jgi:hypothetical protein